MKDVVVYINGNYFAAPIRDEAVFLSTMQSCLTDKFNNVNRLQWMHLSDDARLFFSIQSLDGFYIKPHHTREDHMKTMMDILKKETGADEPWKNQG